MKCNNCDYSVRNDAIYCPNCGSKVTDKKTTKSTSKKDEKEETKVEIVENTNSQTDDTGGAIAFGALGFFIPLVGLILFIVWKNDKPAYSKGAGIGALIRVCLTIFFMILFFLFIFLGAVAFSGI